MHSKLVKRIIIIILIVRCFDDLDFLDNIRSLYYDGGKSSIFISVLINVASLLVIVGSSELIIIGIRLFFVQYTEKIKNYTIMFFTSSVIGIALSGIVHASCYSYSVNIMELYKTMVVVMISRVVWLLILLGAILLIFNPLKLAFDIRKFFKSVTYILIVFTAIIMIYCGIRAVSGQSFKKIVIWDDRTGFDNNTLCEWNKNDSDFENVLGIFFTAFYD